MLKEEINAELQREPFVPFRLHLKDGKKFDVPFRDVAHVHWSGLVVLIGLKQGTHQAKGVNTYAYENIMRIEQLPGGKGGRRRRKAS